MSCSSRYDHLDRRVKKVTPEATHTFFYDGWNLVEERVAYTNGTNSTIRYYWGKDLSGTIGGAGGVGGLLYLTISNSSTHQLYIPWYDAYGNVMGYWDAQGNVVAECTYDAFGKLISCSGPMADIFAIRYSTKYFDPETGLYYYGYRFYSPELMRWITRDPIGEEGGVNLYAFCANDPASRYDVDGQSWLTCFGDCIEEWRLDWSDLLKYSNFPTNPLQMILQDYSDAEDDFEIARKSSQSHVPELTPLQEQSTVADYVRFIVEYDTMFRQVDRLRVTSALG